MNTKRFSIFISSTFEDLRDERRAVQDAVIEGGDFPVQMESFPAADQDPFALITSLLDQCDYYVLIIGGRYGTVTEDGKSYTHKEFLYAVERDIPVLVMLHGNPGQLIADKIEKDPEGRKLLAEFIKEASTGRTRRTWTSVGDLKSAVTAALVHAKQTRPRVGWVRGDSVASAEILGELREVRKQNDEYKEALGNMEIDIPHVPLPPADEIVEIPYYSRRDRKSGLKGTSGVVAASWMSLFLVFQPNLRWGSGNYNEGYWIDTKESCEAIGAALVQEVCANRTAGLFVMDEGAFHKLCAYFLEANLMQSTDHDRPFTEIAERVVRRQHFAKSDGPRYNLVSGLAEVIQYKEPEHVDDDIPF